MINKGIIATNYAIDFVFADTGNLSYDDIYEELSCGNIPDACIVWQPFENFWADGLLQIIDDLANEFIRFHEDLK